MLEEKILKILTDEPDSFSVQSCCIAYGGGSFPGPMKTALMMHLDIIRNKIFETINGEASAERR